jgi:hypothetical protein
VDGISEGVGSKTRSRLISRLSSVLHPPIVEEEDADSRRSVISQFEHIKGAKQQLEQGATLFQQQHRNGDTLVDLDPTGGPVVKEVQLDVSDSEGDSEGDDEARRDDTGAAAPGVRRRRTIRLIIRSRAFL